MAVVVFYAAMLLCMPLRVECGSAQGGLHKSRFASIHYQEPGQLDLLARMIKPTALTASLERIFMGNQETTQEEMAGKYVDRLFLRVQALLEMPRYDMKVQIRLFRDQSELSAAFAGITSRHTHVPAFFWKETNSIYLNIEKASPGILAHEMAHAVIADFFIVTPPEKISELLCRYVDREISKDLLE
ncbi:MAG: hypothetical protein C4576_12510 [Desulfobacteraceae bacterium]|nr:MAG: hypothetical protein C4576_12510 [Desulfobacteraceae bacterium]